VICQPWPIIGARETLFDAQAKRPPRYESLQLALRVGVLLIPIEGSSHEQGGCGDTLADFRIPLVCPRGRKKDIYGVGPRSVA